MHAAKADWGMRFLLECIPDLSSARIGVEVRVEGVEADGAVSVLWRNHEGGNFSEGIGDELLERRLSRVCHGVCALDRKIDVVFSVW